MNAQQRRIINRLIESLDSSLRDGIEIEDVQRDLEANVGVIEVREIRDILVKTIAELDECLHLLGVEDGQSKGVNVVVGLLQRLREVSQCE
jgi:hypothetical protein